MRAPDEKQPRTSADRRDYGEMLEAVVRDPGFRLEVARRSFAKSGNPLHVWQAIDVCIKHKREFPDWVIGYLGGCAERLLSNEARKTHDVRDVLRSAFGFRKPTRGPGNLLDPSSDQNRWLFAMAFAIKIKNGLKPSDALKSACEILPADKQHDEKTLRGWLLYIFEQKKWLGTNAEWKTVVRDYFGPWRGLIRKLFREIAP
jgi:hypothetical protein